MWQPAHCSRASVGQIRLSNGSRITPADWRANRLVDKLAKDAAGFHSLTKEADAFINSSAKLSQHCLAQLAHVTHAANHHSVVRVDEHGTATTHVIRDSMPKPRFERRTNKRVRAPQPPPRDISSVKPWQPETVLDDSARRAKVRRTATVQRAKANHAQIAQCLSRMASKVHTTSTNECSDAKRARLLETVRERQAAAA